MENDDDTHHSCNVSALFHVCPLSLSCLLYTSENLKKLQEQGFTVREIEILTSKSKSSVSRELKAGVVK